MTLTELRYIVTLAQEQHFGHAAERCHVSQPTLSVGVKKLEDELGVLIFERSKSAVRLTPVGEGIVAQAQKVLEQAQGIRELAQKGLLIKYIVASLFRSFPCDVRVACESVGCSECGLQSVDDIIDVIKAARCQAEGLVGSSGSIATVTVYAEQLRQRRPSEYDGDGDCSLLLAHLWNLCKELEWEVALMDAVPDGICLAAVVACRPEQRELFVRQLAQMMVPPEHSTRENRLLVEAGLWMFALFDSERAVQCFRHPRERESAADVATED